MNNSPLNPEFTISTVYYIDGSLYLRVQYSVQRDKTWELDSFSLAMLKNIYHRKFTNISVLDCYELFQRTSNVQIINKSEEEKKSLSFESSSLQWKKTPTHYILISRIDVNLLETINSTLEIVPGFKYAYMFVHKQNKKTNTIWHSQCLGSDLLVRNIKINNTGISKNKTQQQQNHRHLILLHFPSITLKTAVFSLFFNRQTHKTNISFKTWILQSSAVLNKGQ